MAVTPFSSTSTNLVQIWNLGVQHCGILILFFMLMGTSWQKHVWIQVVVFEKSDIPIEGLLQSSNCLTRTHLNNWFNAAWTPVIGRLSKCKAYGNDSINFCERNDAYEYSLVHGKPAVGQGGRPPKVKSPIQDRVPHVVSLN
jgi:hypothetical protein